MRGGTVDPDYKPTNDDNRTLLLILSPDDNINEVNSFMIMKILPAQYLYHCIPLPNNTVLSTGNGTVSLNTVFSSGGVAKLSEALETTFELGIDKYIRFNNSGFEKFYSAFGEIKYTVPTNLKIDGLGPGYQQLAAEHVRRIVTYPDYRGGESRRIVEAGKIVCNILNQANKKHLSDTQDENFKILINAIGTDITEADYNESSKALKYILNYAKNNPNHNPAELKNPLGTESDDGKFEISSSFVDEYLRKKQ
jgi:anionic cell wall polymer biosynthesis LytR-Cps2A-Psr (LCP) family protein